MGEGQSGKPWGRTFNGSVLAEPFHCHGVAAAVEILLNARWYIVSV